MRVLFYIFLLASTQIKAQNSQSVFDQLVSLNKYWECQNIDDSDLEVQLDQLNDKKLIQFHLNYIIKSLRSKDDGFSEAQIVKRNWCLDRLQEYCDRGVFPVNTNHSNRTPYFIDNYGTACAVGYMIIETGNRAFAEQISSENNYAFIEDLTYPELSVWAEENGFTMDELKWIQPAYQNCTTSCSINTKKDVSCYGGNDGCIGMPPISSNNPPYIFNWYYYYAGSWNFWSSFGEACDLYAGDYKCVVTDAFGDIEEFYYTISQPDSVPSNTTVYSCGTYLAPNNQFYNSSGPISILACDSIPYTIDLTILQTSSSYLTIDECQSYIAPDGQVYNSSGVYTAIIANEVGCDSIITIDLNIINNDPIIIQNGDSLLVSITGASYQWLNCDSGFVSLVGDTNQIFVPNSKGHFAVVISQMGCTDTSSCHEYTMSSSVSFSSEAFLNPCFSVYPNPSNGTFQIDLKKEGDYTLNIYDILGRRVYSNNLSNDHIVLDLQEEKGVYLMQISDRNGNVSFGKLIIE